MVKMSSPTLSGVIEPSHTLRYTTEIHENDVLLGRGVPVFTYPGNVRFRALVKERKTRYTSSCRHHIKGEIAREIISIVLERNGRFVREVKTSAEADQLGIPRGTKGYVFVDKNTIEQKVKQALREPDFPSAAGGEVVGGSDRPCLNFLSRGIGDTDQPPHQRHPTQPTPPAIARSIPQSTPISLLLGDMSWPQYSPESYDLITNQLSHSGIVSSLSHRTRRGLDQTNVSASASNTVNQNRQFNTQLIERHQQHSNTNRFNSPDNARYLNLEFNNLVLPSNTVRQNQQHNLLRSYIQRQGAMTRYGPTALGFDSTGGLLESNVPFQSYERQDMHLPGSQLPTTSDPMLRDANNAIRSGMLRGMNPPLTNVTVSESTFNDFLADRLRNQNDLSHLGRVLNPLMQTLSSDATTERQQRQTLRSDLNTVADTSSNNESKLSDFFSNLTEQQLSHVLNISQATGIDRKRKAQQLDSTNPFRRFNPKR